MNYIRSCPRGARRRNILAAGGRRDLHGVAAFRQRQDDALEMAQHRPEVDVEEDLHAGRWKTENRRTRDCRIPASTGSAADADNPCGRSGESSHSGAPLRRSGTQFNAPFQQLLQLHSFLREIVDLVGVVDRKRLMTEEGRNLHLPIRAGEFAGGIP